MIRRIFLLGFAVARWGRLLVIVVAVALIGLQEGGPESSDSILSSQAGAAQPRPDVLDGGTAWLNIENPLSLADLRGRVVLLDFWTLC